MAGKKYELPRPGLDPVAFLAGANGVGYEEGFTPRPRYSRSNATATWEAAAPSVTNELHCNIRPRISIAATLDSNAARRYQSTPYMPGRVPAPRIELSCGHLGDPDIQASGALARDLVFRPTTKDPLPEGPQFPGGPQPNPPGLNPLPPPIAPQPPTPPLPPLAPAPPLAPQPPTTPTAPMPPTYSPRVPGTLQAINFHLTGDIAGGAAASEIRVFGPVGSPFILRECWINTDTGAQPGQFLDILVSGDGDTTDTANPTGESIFPLLDGVGNLPNPDRERGLAIPAGFLSMKMSYRVDNPDRWLKVRQYFIAPALSLPNIHVTLIIERMDVPGMFPPPILPRPPILPPDEPAPTPPSAPLPPSTPTTSFYVDPKEGPNYTAPAWRVAAQGLARTRTNLLSGNFAAMDAYGAWLLSPTSDAAAPFRDRINTVLERAGVTDGNHNTYVSLSLALPPSA